MTYTPDYVRYCLTHYGLLAAGRFPRRAEQVNTGARPLESRAPNPALDTKADIDRAIRALPADEQDCTLALIEANGSVHGARRIVGRAYATVQDCLDRAVARMALTLGWHGQVDDWLDEARERRRAARRRRWLKQMLGSGAGT